MDWLVFGEQAAPILTAVLGVVAVVCIIVVFRARRTARTASFGFVRERSDLLAKRFLIVAIIDLMLVGASGALWRVTIKQPELLPQPMPTSTLTPIPSPTPRTPTVTFTPTSTPTVTPTPTITVVPADAVLPSALRTPFPRQAVSAGPEAALVDLVLAPARNGDQPVNPTSHFPASTERVYAFFTFDGMARNVPWVHVWYSAVDGQMIEVWSQVELWATDAPRGYMWRYFHCRPGRYELHIYVDHRLEQQVPFVVGE